MALGHRSSEITYVTAHSTSFVWKQFKDHVLTVNSISVPTAFPSTIFREGVIDFACVFYGPLAQYSGTLAT